jgi:8-oxo-dGTP diphosphatase
MGFVTPVLFLSGTIQDGAIVVFFDAPIVTLNGGSKRARGCERMIEYVAGFLFDSNRKIVALIQKNRPAWQAGRWNAIGGKVEQGETPDSAMRREFQEETGVDIDRWRRFVTLTDARGWRVHFFRAFGDTTAIKQTSDEVPGVFYVNDLPLVIPNLYWLIPMAFSMDEERCQEFTVIERQQNDEE